VHAHTAEDLDLRPGEALVERLELPPRRLSGSPYASAVEEFTAAYYDLRFAGNRDAALRMVSLMEAIERQGSAKRAAEA